ncbi:MAG: hypothetical protein JWP01_2490 [Myxococcales bacterium]|nr:hypothetical protein [Myxococcales bacterium]
MISTRCNALRILPSTVRSSCTAHRSVRDRAATACYCEWMKRVLLAVILIGGCWSGSSPAEPPPPREPAGSNVKRSSSIAASQIKLEITEGTPASLPDGTTIDINHVVYAHMTDGQNLSAANLIVERDGERVELGLNRHHAGPAADAARTGQALGWELVLEMADPYQRPSRAIVLARKLTP